jgi:hypothetical protein
VAYDKKVTMQTSVIPTRLGERHGQRTDTIHKGKAETEAGQEQEGAGCAVSLFTNAGAGRRGFKSGREEELALVTGSWLGRRAIRAAGAALRLSD